jgi:benzoate-CoA ligase family protein
VSSFNICAYLVDRWVVAGRGERVAVRARGVSTTYQELLDLVRGVAGGLRSLGVRPEERVAFVLLDSPEFVAMFLAVMRIGAVPLPLNPLLPAGDLALTIADARARVVVLSPERLSMAEDLVAAAPDVGHVVVTGDASPHEIGPIQVHALADLVAAKGNGSLDRTSEDSPGFWLCTSGTTGRPKLVMHRHVDLRNTAEGYAREVLGIGGGDRCFSVGPLFHAYGLGNALSFPLSVGATTILESRRPPRPEVVADIVRAECPTLFFAVPTFYAALLASDVPADAFASVRQGVSAGEPLPGGLLNRFRERFGVEILDGIGSTEMTHIYVSNRPGKSVADSSGTVVGGYTVRVTDEHGNDVAPGTAGELRVSGLSAATGYWCRSGDTRSRFHGEWFRTGDMYTCDDVGRYAYLGRVDDMFKVGGEWVAPAEVEAVLIAHPQVLEAVVVAGARADGLIVPVAFVSAIDRSTIDPNAVIEHCRGRLAGFKRPRQVVVLDALPKTATGKIHRVALRELASNMIAATTT